jgi:hypothetical protein
MKLGELRKILAEAAEVCGDDASVDVEGLYSSCADINEVTWFRKVVKTDVFTNGVITSSREENQSLVSIKTDLCTD